MQKKKGILHMLHVWEPCQQRFNSNAHFPKCPWEEKKKKPPKQNIFHLEEARQNNEEGLTPKDIYLFTI